MVNGLFDRKMIHCDLDGTGTGTGTKTEIRVWATP